MQFHISDVLTVITGRMLSRDGIQGVYRILNYMTGDNIYTHQIPRALDACAPVLAAQYPHLADANRYWQGADTPETIAEWVARFGEGELEVSPIAGWQTGRAAADLVEMAGSVERVIPLDPNDPNNTRN